MRVCPLTQGGLNESFRLAVCPCTVGFGPQLPDAGFSNGFSKQLRAVGRTVVGHDALDLDAVAGIPGQRPFEKGRRILAAEGGKHFDISEARSIVDGDIQMIPADPAFAASAVAGDPVSDAVDLAQAFDIDLDQLARSLALIAVVALAPTVERTMPSWAAIRGPVIGWRRSASIWAMCSEAVA